MKRNPRGRKATGVLHFRHQARSFGLGQWDEAAYVPGDHDTFLLLRRDAYNCFISAAVLDELRDGEYPNKEACLALVEAIHLLAVTREVLDIAGVYQLRGLMPKPPSADALHLALASFYRMDFLLTWSCRHIANANKIKHFEILNHGMGLPVPRLVTPHQLQPWEETDEG